MLSVPFLIVVSYVMLEFYLYAAIDQIVVLLVNCLVCTLCIFICMLALIRLFILKCTDILIAEVPWQLIKLFMLALIRLFMLGNCLVNRLVCIV